MQRLILISLIIFTLTFFWQPVQASELDNTSEQLWQSGDVFPLGQTVTGILTPVAAEHEWSLDVPTGTSIALTVIRTSGNAPLTIQMFNAIGNLVISLKTDDQGVVNLPLLYLEGGVYHLTLSGDFNTGAGDTGYELSVSPINFDFATPQPTSSSAQPTLPPTPGNPASIGRESTRLELGDVYIGEFTQDGDTHRFSFLGFAEMQITFGLHALEGATFDPFIQLQAPNGEIIAEDDNHNDSLDALVINFELPATGVYTIYATSIDGLGTGAYLLALNEGFILRDVEQGETFNNEPIVAELEAYGVRDVWVVELAAGDTVTISVEVWDDTDEFFDPMVELVAPDGESLAFNDDGGDDRNAFLADVVAPTTGTYRIHIAAFSHDSIGAYRLSWQRERLITETTTSVPTSSPTLAEIPSSPTPTATQPEPESVALTESGSELLSVDFGGALTFEVELETGQVFDVRVEGHWGFDGVLEISRPDGTLLELVDDIGFGQNYDINPRLTLIVEEDGVYVLRVYGYQFSAGEFTLHWEIR